MKKLIVLGVLLWVSQFSFGQGVKTTIEDLEKKRFAAQVAKDGEYLNKILADDLIYVHSSGKTDNKESYVASVLNGSSVYSKVDIEAMLVRTYNKEKTAVVNGTVMITQPPVDGKPVLLHLRYLAVYTKDSKKGWQFNSWQSSKLPN
ncbi:nuclear transport factor 2 family protein [Emticicia sp. BO119]|uniref:nuclear transport factor 2 family protein n=1 Tax=Emticicia sp. BO119 TaxID=2757768 RepID=UPI0015F083FA|nr:nuclear transport factor 2 family protein [Emticicia sp. BO119]MBA4852692.1 nuclear transport factor 2 family protein [Emticicia sp. BO119]